MPIGWILFGLIAIASFAVQQMLKSKFNKYSKVPLSSGMTGRDVAEKMLHDNGIYDVKVVFQRDIRSIRFTGECKRTESVEDFMKVMGLTKEFGYEIQNKTIIIK